MYNTHIQERTINCETNRYYEKKIICSVAVYVVNDWIFQNTKIKILYGDKKKHCDKYFVFII